jgi:hypothetical protein
MSTEKREDPASPIRGREAAASRGGIAAASPERDAGRGEGADRPGGAATDGEEQLAGAVNKFDGEGAQTVRDGEEPRPPLR